MVNILFDYFTSFLLIIYFILSLSLPLSLTLPTQCRDLGDSYSQLM